jgi:GT2 family glycosyltransferase
MLKSINNNLQIFIKAIGNEPLSQIVGNAVRKIVGIEPVVAAERKNDYKKYIQTRNSALFEKRIRSNRSEKLSIILIDKLSSDNFHQSFQSLLDQRVKPNQLFIISKRKKFKTKGAKVFDDLAIAISQVETDYIAFGQSDHVFHPCYIQELILYLDNYDVDILHSCYDIYQGGRRQDPQWLPQLNQHLLYGYNYIGNSLAVKRSIGNKLNWFNIENFKNAYIYDFLIRAIDSKASFYCLPDILYSLKDGLVKDGITEREKILQEHIRRNSWSAKTGTGLVQDTLRIKWDLLDSPLVSIIIPFRDKVELLRSCIESIIEKTDYQNYEIILADNRSQENETNIYIQKLLKEQEDIVHLIVDMDFNFSAINNYAVSKCSGDYLLFLNNDTEVINDIWLTEMVQELQNPRVGVVGAKLLYEDDTVQHAGVIYGIGHVAGHIFRNFDQKAVDQTPRINLTQEYLAVTGACLLTKRTIYDQIGGFDAINLAIAYNDVDFCLKVNQLGYKVVYTPYANLYHYESKSRDHDLSEKEKDRYNKECIFMREKWDFILKTDPFFHPVYDVRFEDLKVLEQ